MKYEIKSSGDFSGDTDIRCWVNIDEKGDVTTQYLVIKRQNDCAMMVPLAEYTKMTGKEPYPVVDLVPVGTEFGIYKNILIEAAKVKGKSPDSIHIITPEELYKEEIELAKAAELKEKSRRREKEAKRISELLIIAKKTNSPQVIYCGRLDGENITGLIHPDGSKTEERSQCESDDDEYEFY